MTSAQPVDPHGITCRELVVLVTEYLEGALPDDKRLLFEAHLGHCEGCRHHLVQVRMAIAVVGRLRETDLSPEFRERMLGAFRSWNR